MIGETGAHASHRGRKPLSEVGRHDAPHARAPDTHQECSKPQQCGIARQEVNWNEKYTQYRSEGHSAAPAQPRFRQAAPKGRACDSAKIESDKVPERFQTRFTQEGRIPE